MRRTWCWLMAGCLLAGACDGNLNVDWNQLLNQIAEQLQPQDGADTGPASVLQFSNISFENLTGTVEVFYELSDGTTTRQVAVIEVPPDYSAPFDIGCPSSIRFTGTLGELDVAITVERGVDYQCGRILEFAASAGLVQFVNTPL